MGTSVLKRKQTFSRGRAVPGKLQIPTPKAFGAEKPAPALAGCVHGINYSVKRVAIINETHYGFTIVIAGLRVIIKPTASLSTSKRL